MTYDIYEFLEHMAQERYRAIIVHAAPEKGPNLTLFVKKMCNHTGGKYLDLLEQFIKSDDLKEKIDQFGVEELRKHLIEQSRDQTVLVVDNIDFLLDTWRTLERKSFYNLIKLQWDGFKEATKAVLIICLQSTPEIEAQKIFDSKEQSRILHLSDFNDIL